MKIVLILLASLPLFAADKQEEKLADAAMKAHRKAVHAIEDGHNKDKVLDEYCHTKNQQEGIRQVDSLLGCVPIPPVTPIDISKGEPKK
jgi:hypothetical protein